MTNCWLPEDITRMLLEHRFGVLATYGGEYPYTSLVSLVILPDVRSLIFPTLRETRKYTNLLNEARVSVLLDNRSSIQKKPENIYALTVLGSAREADEARTGELGQLLLQHHPQVADFLLLPHIAIIQVVITKVILVEELQKIRVFDCPR